MRSQCMLAGSHDLRPGQDWRQKIVPGRLLLLPWPADAPCLPTLFSRDELLRDRKRGGRRAHSDTVLTGTTQRFA